MEVTLMNSKMMLSIALAAGVAACSSAPTRELDQQLYMPSSSETRLQYVTPKPAPLAEDRKINDQDCSKPVDFYSGNLRCRPQ